MTVLVLALAIDCTTTMLVGEWKVGPPVSYTRTVVSERVLGGGGMGDIPKGCRIGWASSFEPDLIAWCNFLNTHGAGRCALEFPSH